MSNTSLINFFKKFWVQDKIEDTLIEINLPLTDLSSYTFYTDRCRKYTIEIYNNDGITPLKIIEDDGEGNLTPLYSEILNTSTGYINTVSYNGSIITLTWNSTYLSGLINPPTLKFKYYSVKKENHVEMLEFLGEVFQIYKEEELDDRIKYYNPEDIPLHLIETLAKDHNWVIDKIFSEDEEYLRRQLKYLYDLYKSKRTLSGVNFAISIINKRINLYNLLAKKNNYNDYSEYIIFDLKTLYQQLTDATPGTEQETIASEIQSIFDSLYAPSSDYYPTKHFLLDLSLDILNNEGNLLNTLDLKVLKDYILKIKSKSQYPHLQAYLGILADATDVHQDSSQFLFKLTTEEQTYSISSYRTLYTGPYEVESMAQLGDGAWLILPFRYNEGHTFNSGLLFNMGLGDIVNYLTYFKVGKDSYDTLDAYLMDMKDPFYTSTNMTIIYDTDYYYMTLKLDENEANDYPIKEVGVYNDQDKLAFYIKFPNIYKTDNHKLYFRLKLKVSGTL